MATATEQLQSDLEQAGLGALAQMVWNLYREGREFDYIYQQIVESSTYQSRFSGLVTLREQGKAAGMDEAQYLQVERAMRQELSARGFEGSRYTSPEYLGSIIGNDISVEEFRARVQMAEAAATTMPTDVRAELRERYGIGGQDLLAYYMDTDETVNRLLREQQAAALATQYERFQTMEVSTSDFEDIARQLTADPGAAINAQEQFASLGTLGAGFTDRERVEGALGLNDMVAAQRRRRAARFAARGSGAATQEGIGGLGSAEMG